MKTKKKKQIKKYLFTISLFIIFVLSFIDVKAQPKEVEPINYDFNNNILLDKDGSYEPDMYNIRNQSKYNGHYESIYSFENDQIGSLPKGFVDISGTNSSGIIVDELRGHKNVLNLTDDSESTRFYLRQFFDKNQIESTISFWWSSNTSNIDAHCFLHIDLVSSGILAIRIGFNYYDSNEISYFDNFDIWQTIYDNVVNNTWYYVSFNFSCITNTFDFYLNNDLVLANCEFNNDVSFISNIDFLSRGESLLGSYIHSIDSLDYSWNFGYYENRNLIPIKEYTNQYEVDKYEFDYNVIGFETDSYSWIQNEYNSTTNDVGVYVSGEQSINKYIDIWSPAYVDSYENGIQFNDNSSSYIVNISMSIEINVLDTWCAHLIWIYTQNIDLNYPIGIKFNGATNNIDVYNISLLNWQTIGTFLVDIIYEVNFYLNYYDNIMIITIDSTEGFIKGIFPLDDNDKWDDLYGLDYIQINNSISSMGTIAELFVYNVGIYENGKYFQSFLDNREFGLMIYEIDDTWYSLNHNLITVNSENDYQLYVFSDCAKFLCGVSLRIRSIQSKREIINFQDDFDYSIPFLVFMLFDNFSVPYEVKIEGISLIRDDIESFGSYIYHNCNSDNNYFYVIDNELYYNFNNSLDSGIETMIIEFDVIDVLLDIDVLFTYTSYISSFYEGYVILETYGYFELFNISNNSVPIIKSYNLYNLTNIKKFTLTEIRIYIRTDILDNAEGLTKGFVRNLNIWLEVPLLPDYDPIGILELDFLEAMIHVVVRLIIFMIPSLAFRYKFGNKSVIPMWFLMAIVLVISGFIPFWLFFVNILAIGLMLITKKEGM